MDNVDLAKDGMEHAHHQAAERDPWTLKSAMFIAGLAAAAVVAEMSANDAQTSYLAAHISASDTWTQYQAKSIRRSLYLQSAATIQSVAPKSAEILQAQDAAARMLSEPGKDGMKQLTRKATNYEKQRDHDLHLHDGFEVGVRGLQIAILLASLSVATHMRRLFLVAAAIGGCSALFALLVGFGIV